MANRNRILAEARALLASGREAEADRLLVPLLEADPGDAEAMGLLAEARMALTPENPMAHILMATAEQRAGRPRRAIAHVRTALRLDPDNAAALTLLGFCQRDSGAPEKAIEPLERAAALLPGSADAQLALANVLRDAGRPEDAIAAYRAGIALDAESVAIHSNLAVTLQQLGELASAREHFEAAIAKAPEQAAIHYNLAILDLLCGRFADGFARYDWRWRKKGEQNRARPFPQPQWDGAALADKTILVWSEQGVGDEIMFASLFTDVIAAAKSVIIECEARLQPLFARSFPAAEVIARSDPPDARLSAGHIDVQSSAGGLCKWLRRKAGDFNEPRAYLRADAGATEAVRLRYGASTVGIAWHSKTPFWGDIKTAPLARWRPILATPDMTWVNLQYGDCAAELAALPVAVLQDAEIDQMADLDAFAAQVAAMDQVITTSNTTAHMAGALGVPCRLLLPLVPDWRWQLAGESALWYPNTRIYRQSRRGDWDTPIEAVAVDLNQGGDAAEQG
jgi:tetratricopeptide (TPR) repeat protein